MEQPRFRELLDMARSIRDRRACAQEIEREVLRDALEFALAHDVRGARA
jgi:hypothetical protein